MERKKALERRCIHELRKCDLARLRRLGCGGFAHFFGVMNIAIAPSYLVYGQATRCRCNVFTKCDTLDFLATDQQTFCADFHYIELSWR